MFPVSPYAPEYRLLWRNGYVLRFESLLEVARYARDHRLLGWHRDELGDDFGPSFRSLNRGSSPFFFEWQHEAPNIICRTEHGDVVTVEDLRAVFRSRRPAWYSRPEQRVEDYRCAPVPGVHKSRGYHWYRHPQTRRDLEQVAAYTDELREHGLSPNKVGRVRDIVSAWDDISRSCEKSWKSHRKTQYRTG